MDDVIISWNFQNFFTVVLMSAIFAFAVVFVLKAVRGKFGSSDAQ